MRVHAAPAIDAEYGVLLIGKTDEAPRMAVNALLFPLRTR
jgi:hypothetical protein